MPSRRVRLTNLDKVLYPAAGFTKAEVVTTTRRRRMLPHLRTGA
jgi:DNA primase